jgi:very-short-patch-repair endonuclease
MSSDISTVVDQLARDQHGLVTSAQAVKALGPSRKQRWVSQRRLVSVQPGVFRVNGAPESWHQAVLAAALAADAVVSHRSAAELWGLIKPAGFVDVSVRPDRQPCLRPPAILHRIGDLHPELAVERAGMTVTDPIRTVIDLGLVLPKWAVSDALSRGLTTRLFDVAAVERLRDALGRQGRNGTGVIRMVIDERLLAAVPEESLLEKRFMTLIRRSGLPVPSFQHEVWQGGRFMARVDAAYPSLRLAIEVDGYDPHSSPAAFQRDRTRQNRLVALGWTVLRFTWHDVVREPGSVAAAIRGELSRLSAA